jgi:hypothetical protein
MLISEMESGLWVGVLASPGFPIIPVIFIMLGSGLTALWIWQFIKCYTQEHAGIQKTFWLIFIAFTNFLGALAYLLYTEYPRRYKYKSQAIEKLNNLLSRIKG